MVVAVSRALEAGRPLDRLRLDRQHVGLGGGLRRGGRARGRRRPARAARSRRASSSRRSSPGPGSSRSTATSTRRSGSSASSPPATTTRSPSSTRSTRTGWPARRPRRSRSATTSAGPPTSWRSRSATPATSAPTGPASATTATAGLTAGLPRMYGFQAAGAAPIVLGHPVAEPETVATAIRIGDPASWTKATAARDESGGLIEAVTDDEILAAYRDLARLEGVFCEPSSAAGVAGVRQLVAAGRLGVDRRCDDRVRPDRQRAQGPAHGRGPGRWRSSTRGRRPRRSSPRSAGSVPGRRAGWSRTGWRSSTGGGSPSRSRRRAPTSAPATTAWAWPST